MDAELWQTDVRAHRARFSGFEQLNERENQVCCLLALGAINATIAGALGLSEGTVRNTVARLITKLGVVDRTQAALLCYQAGLHEYASDLYKDAAD